jgi:predicted neuraminidase
MIPVGRRGRSIPLLGFVLVAFAAGFVALRRIPPPAPFAAEGAAATPGGKPYFATDFVSSRQAVQSHAVSIMELSGGRIRAFWYSGSEEGAPDVNIQTAIFDPGSARWGAERTIATPAAAERELWRYVRKVGNPAAGRAADGSIRLFYVTVSVGGWSGSSINAMTSRDEGETWGRTERVITTPFFNLSTLVKAPPVLQADGTLSLPVYEEFMGKFGELLRFDRSGRLIDKTRLSSGRSTLQPIVLVESPERAFVFQRHSGPTLFDQLLRAATEDGGRHWSRPVSASLPNSDSAMSGLILPDGRILMAFNSSEGTRAALALAVSGDGGLTWQPVFLLEDQAGQESRGLDGPKFRALVGRLARASDARMRETDATVASVERLMSTAQGNSFEYSYPSLIRARRGDFHLIYTWNRAFLKHVEFNQAWLDQHLPPRP